MPERTFEPKVGMKCNDMFLHGLGRLGDIDRTGTIAFVGKFYFIIEGDNIQRILLIRDESYNLIEKGDFT